MIRIAGVNLLSNKNIIYALTKIYGIGIVSAKSIVKKTKIKTDSKVNELTDKEIKSIRQLIENEFEVEGDLRRKINLNIKRLSDIKCFRGRRHRAKLPVRGQRSKTNARCRRGRRKSKMFNKNKKTDKQYEI